VPDRATPAPGDTVRPDPPPPVARRGEPCAGCGAPVATRHDAPGGSVWLCPACAATSDLGCP